MFVKNTTFSNKYTHTHTYIPSTRMHYRNTEPQFTQARKATRMSKKKKERKKKKKTAGFEEGHIYVTMTASTSSRFQAAGWIILSSMA